MESKYQIVVNWIKEGIKAGRLLPGSKLYSENELSRMFSLSRQTVRRALEILEEDGSLERKRGSGTYIARPRAERRIKKRVAIITTYVDGYIFPKTIRAIVDTLAKEGYSVQISFTSNRISKEKAVLEEILEKDEVGAIIVEATKSNLPNPNKYLYEKIMERNIPIMFFNCYYPGLKAPHVCMDDVQACCKITKYLIDNGHKKIGGVFKLDDGQGRKRYQGFLKTLNENGISITENEIVWLDTVDIRDMESSMTKIESRLRDCTGIVAYNDEVAAKMVEGFEKRGIRIPDNKSIVGIDNSTGLVNGHVKLTTIQYPAEELVHKMVENLLEKIENPHFEATYEFDVELIEGNSVKRI